MNEILLRLKTSTPTFFKNIINIALSVTTLSGLLLGSGVVFPESVMGLISQAGIIAGIVAAFVAKLTSIYKIKDGEIVEDMKYFTINPDTKPNPPKKER